MFKKTIFTLLALSAIACGKGGGSGSSAPAAPSCVEELNLFTENQANQVIIDDLQWQSTTTLTDAMKASNAAATVYLSLPAQYARCTGFLINDDMIMTNNHCVSNANEARGAKATFGYTKDSKGETFECGEFVATNRALDYGIIRCQGSPGKKYPKVVLAEFDGKAGDPIYITHQNCDYRNSPSCSPTQKYSPGELLGATRSIVEHNADTLGGSSGSPIFDKDSHKVVGLHNAGASYANGGGINYGIPMASILEHLRANYPSIAFNASPDRQPAYQSCGI